MIASDSSSSSDVLTERPLTLVSIRSTPPPTAVEVVMVEYPPALALFDDELVQDTTDGDVQFSGEDAIVRLRNLISAHSDGQVGQG